jgi:hypothetical protein
MQYVCFYNQLRTMQATYFHQAILRLPLPVTTSSFSAFPVSNRVLDEWLEVNRVDAYRRDVMLAGFLDIRDVPTDQVLCTFIVTKIAV